MLMTIAIFTTSICIDHYLFIFYPFKPIESCKYLTSNLAQNIMIVEKNQTKKTLAFQQLKFVNQLTIK